VHDARLVTLLRQRAHRGRSARSCLGVIRQQVADISLREIVAMRERFEPPAHVAMNASMSATTAR